MAEETEVKEAINKEVQKAKELRGRCKQLEQKLTEFQTKLGVKETFRDNNRSSETEMDRLKRKLDLQTTKLQQIFAQKAWSKSIEQTPIPPMTPASLNTASIGGWGGSSGVNQKGCDTPESKTADSHTMIWK